MADVPRLRDDFAGRADLFGRAAKGESVRGDDEPIMESTREATSKAASKRLMVRVWAANSRSRFRFSTARFAECFKPNHWRATRSTMAVVSIRVPGWTTLARR